MPPMYYTAQQLFRSNTARVAWVRKNATVLQSTDVFAIFSKINEGAS